MKRMHFFLITLAMIAITSKASALSIASYNIRNYDYDTRSRVRTDKTQLRKILLKTNADLIGIQEIVNADDFKLFVSLELPNYKVALTTCGGMGKQKLGFLYNSKALKLKRFRQDKRLSSSSSEGPDERCSGGLRPAAIGEFTEKDSGLEFTAIAVHLKAGGKQSNADIRFLQYGILTEIMKEIRDDKIDNIVVMGDFNSTDYNLRNHNYGRFIDFVEINDMVDYAARLECSAYWWGGIDDDYEYGSLLDHVMVSENFKKQFSSSRSEVQAHCKKVSCEDSPTDLLGISFKKVSDHCPVIAKFNN